MDIDNSRGYLGPQTSIFLYGSLTNCSQSADTTGMWHVLEKSRSVPWREEVVERGHKSQVKLTFHPRATSRQVLGGQLTRLNGGQSGG
jgi:hypothetical protein